MEVERSHFLLMTGALAAGAAGGWFGHDYVAGKPMPPPPPIVVEPAKTAPSASVAALPPKPAAPTCSDDVGTPEDCPSVGPSEEGGCANVIFKRCNDYKASFKPKVAQAAVACLKKLKGAEACDPARVNLCGHLALEAACPEPTADEGKTSGPVATACEGIVKSCGGAPIGATASDCKQTLSGLNEAGRASMVTCVAAHCADKGLLGCEGLKDGGGPAAPGAPKAGGAVAAPTVYPHMNPIGGGEPKDDSQ